MVAQCLGRLTGHGRDMSENDPSASAQPEQTGPANQDCGEHRTAAFELLDAAISGLGGESRPGQRELVGAVADAIDRGHHLVAQAPTGSGKSLGYLVPAIASGVRTVVSTVTIALQDQLIGKDLPDLAAHTDTPFSFAVLKGRGQYLCLAKLGAVRKPDALFDVAPSEGFDVELDRCEELAATSMTADRSEIEVSDGTWLAVSCGPNECPGARHCPEGEQCFAELARSRAAAAQVLVVNHALYSQHLASGGRVLPDHDIVAFDEGHALVEAATSAFSETVTAAGIVQLASRCRKLGVAVTVCESLGQLGRSLGDILDERVGRVRIGRDVELIDALSAINERLSELDAALAARSQKVSDETAGLAVTFARRKVEGRREALGRLLADSTDDVCFMERDGRSPALRCVPIDVGNLLGPALSRRTTIMVSATLGGVVPFESFTRRVGLSATAPLGPIDGAATPDWDSAYGNGDTSGDDANDTATSSVPGFGYQPLDVASPFDWEDAALLYVPRDRLVVPTASEWFDGAADELVSLVNAAGGRTLVLCTAKASVERFATVLRERTDHPVLAQGEAGRSRLTQQFRSDERSCLVATRSFWEGLDVPGSACVLVVIDKLPFPSPDDPLMSARRERAEREGNPGWASVDLPACALGLAQGVGRLIRHSGDRGVVAVLDVRLATAGYRDVLLGGLPPARRCIDHDAALAFLTDVTARVGFRDPARHT